MYAKSPLTLIPNILSPTIDISLFSHSQVYTHVKKLLWICLEKV